jgi:hypothetical protein
MDREGGWSGMDVLRKTLVVAVVAFCVLSIAASCFLALSYAVLKGLADLRPLIPLLVLILQSALTLAALSGIAPGVAIDVLVFAGAIVVAWGGYSTVEHTLSGPHFEGYALVLGAAAVLQGILTIMLSLWRMKPRARASFAPADGSQPGSAVQRRARRPHPGAIRG